MQSVKERTYRLKPAITWPGGKSRLLKYILPLIPKHECYVEPFCGGLAVLLAKERSPMEVINDINQELVTFYRCVRYHTDSLLTELNFVLNSRQEFYDFRDQPGLTDIQKAARWYFRNKNCFGGANMDTFGTSAKGGGAAYGSRMNRMESIQALNYRLDKVVIEHLDWQKCVEQYDRSGTFFFIDPPYTGCHAGMYAAWTETDVLKLRDRLKRLKGRWMVTLNDTAPIHAIFSGCKMKSVERQLGICNRNGGKRYKELIITPK